MTSFGLGELGMVWQFVPTLFLLVGLTALWTRTVCFSPTVNVDGPTPVAVSLFGSGHSIKRFGYYFHSYLFDRKLPTFIIKSNLLWLIGLTFALELLVNSSTWSTGEIAYYFNDMLVHSPAVLLMKLLVLAFMWGSIVYVNPRESSLSASTLMLVGTVLFFMLILVSSNNFICLYIALEGISLLLFVITAQPKTFVSVEAGLKYFFQSSFASILLLAGIALVFAETQDFDFVGINWSMLNEPVTIVSTLGCFLITVALLFKVSSFPGHFWAPDVYCGPTSSVLTVFAVVVKLAAFLALFNVYSHFLTVIHVHFSSLLYLASASSMLIGAVGAIRVVNEAGSLRKFVAYTSINQVGFVRLGLVCVSSEGLVASFVYLIVYLLSSLLFLGVLSRIRVGDVGQQGITRLDELRGLFNSEYKFSRRTDLLILAYSVWSMAGLPPLAGFFGKLARWSAILRKMDSLVSGSAWLEVKHAFKFVDASLEFDPFLSLGFILMLSIVVSIISGVYYFKLYELMSPSASNAEITKRLMKNKMWMMHDKSSISLTIALLIVLVSWFAVICWTGWSYPFSFPSACFDYVWGTWANEFNGYLL
jgi:NADH-quinone oxidoreductase subunit N